MLGNGFNELLAAIDFKETAIEDLVKDYLAYKEGADESDYTMHKLPNPFDYQISSVEEISVQFDFELPDVNALKTFEEDGFDVDVKHVKKHYRSVTKHISDCACDIIEKYKKGKPYFSLEPEKELLEKIVDEVLLQSAGKLQEFIEMSDDHEKNCFNIHRLLKALIEVVVLTEMHEIKSREKKRIIDGYSMQYL